MVFLAITSLFILDSNKNEVSWVRLMVSSIVGALAMLVKPQAAFLLLPVLPLLFKRPFTIRMVFQCIIWGVIVLLPFLWWRTWIAQYPEGIPAFDWLLNKNDIRFKGAWFYWLFADRIGRLILGYWGLIPFGIGLIYATKREGFFFRLFVIGVLLYLSVIAGGNVQHDYYQILLIPMIAIYTAKGITNFWEQKEEGRSLLLSRGMVVVSLAFMLSFSWYFVRSNYWINHPEIIEAGKLADQLLPKDAKVIAAYNGDTTFLYQTKRSGWPLNFDIDKKIAMGATAYVTISPTDNDLETKELAEKYTVLVRNEKYAIIDLTRKK